MRTKSANTTNTSCYSLPCSRFLSFLLFAFFKNNYAKESKRSITGLKMIPKNNKSAGQVLKYRILISTPHSGVQVRISLNGCTFHQTIENMNRSRFSIRILEFPVNASE